MIRWSEIATRDGGTLTPEQANDLRRTDSIRDVYLARVGGAWESAEDDTTWGPRVEDVDWTGLDEALAPDWDYEGYWSAVLGPASGVAS